MYEEYTEYSFAPDYQEPFCLPELPTRINSCPTRASLILRISPALSALPPLVRCLPTGGKIPGFPVGNPARDCFDAIVRTAEEKSENTILDYVNKLKSIDTGDAKDVAEHCIGWARRRAIYLAVEKAGTSFNAGDVPEDGFISLFQDALKVGQNLEDLGYIIGPDDNDIERVVKEYTSEGYAISSGFPELDKLLPSKGFEPGWLISILAPPKRYKTTVCINIGMNIARAGRPVFYYPCEITQKLAAIRTLCNLTGRGIETIRQNPKGFTELA